MAMAPPPLPPTPSASMCRPAACATNICECRLSRNCAVPVIEAHLGERAHLDQADDVGDPLQPAERGMRLVDHAPGVVLPGDVADEGGHAQFVRHRSRAALVDVGDGDARAGLLQQHGGDPPRAIAAADDQRRHAFQAENLLHPLSPVRLFDLAAS